MFARPDRAHTRRAPPGAGLIGNANQLTPPTPLGRARQKRLWVQAARSVVWTLGSILKSRAAFRPRTSRRVSSPTFNPENSSSVTFRLTGNVPVDLKDRFSFDFLNTPLLEDFGLSKMLRIFGPNMSPISFGYGIAFFGLFLFSAGRPLLALCALPLLVLCGVKGPLILVVFVVLAWTATRLIGARLTLVLTLLALIGYAAFAIRLGLQIGDYHVIGFMGGWHGFLERPFGRGLGVGGNLSDSYFSIDWSAAQQAGTMDGAVESAIGVLLYQMGFAALLPIGFYFAVGLKAWRLYASSALLMQGLAGFGIMVVLFNGIFQEEAMFAPPALGLLLSLAGLAIGNQIRTQTASDIHAAAALRPRVGEPTPA